MNINYVDNEVINRTSGEWVEKDLQIYSLSTGTTLALLTTSGGKNGITSEEAQANGEFICKAVNNHDTLLEALTDLNNKATCFADDHKHYYDTGNFGKIDELLAKFHNAHLKAKEVIKNAGG